MTAARTPALAQSVATYKVGDIVVTAPWSPATPNGARVAAGYLRITNTGTESDRLTSADVPFASRVEIHEMTMADGVMRMRELAEGVEIRPGETVELKPGGRHIMFIGLTTTLKAGDAAKASLTFKRAGPMPVEFAIAPASGQNSGAAHKH